MGDDGRFTAHTCQSFREVRTRGNQTIGSSHDVSFESLKGCLVKPWPAAEIVHAVIDPPPDRHDAHEIRRHGDGGDGDGRSLQTIDCLAYLPPKEQAIDPAMC